MIRYILGRLAILPLSLLIVSLISFSFVRLVPGDAVDVLSGESMDEAGRAQLRAQYGLDKPVPVQFGIWLWGAVNGDLGTSIATRRPVAQEVVSRLAVTVELAVLAIIAALILGILGGAIATRWRDSWVERVVLSASTLAISVPNYFAATMFVLIISLYMPSWGVVSYVAIEKNLWGNLLSLVFPALSIAILTGGTLCRYVRGATDDVLRNADFVRTARSKGASETRILLRHVMPNAMVPLATVAGLQFAYLMGGTVVIESIFALPGIGRLMLTAISQRDYPVVQGCVLLQASIFICINLMVDLLYPVLDPRVRLGRGAA